MGILKGMKHEKQTCSCNGKAWRECQERKENNGLSNERKEGRETEEEWKDIPGYEGKYQASTDGRIKSLTRYSRPRVKGIYLIKEKILKPYMHKTGYLMVTVFGESGKKKNKKIHQLVAKTFIPNPKMNKQLDHINRIRHDNRVENLRWCTHAENAYNMTCKGYWFVRKENVYQSEIIVNGKRHWLGRFKNKEDAIKAREVAELKYRPEFLKPERMN